jgi:hypothetical protein
VQRVRHIGGGVAAHGCTRTRSPVAGSSWVGRLEAKRTILMTHTGKENDCLVCFKMNKSSMGVWNLKLK